MVEKQTAKAMRAVIRSHRRQRERKKARVKDEVSIIDNRDNH